MPPICLKKATTLVRKVNFVAININIFPIMNLAISLRKVTLGCV